MIGIWSSCCFYYSDCPTFLSILMGGMCLKYIFLVKLSNSTAYVSNIFFVAFSSQVLVQNPAALPSNLKKPVTASWEPTVLATIIIPSMWGLLSPSALSGEGSCWSIHLATDIIIPTTLYVSPFRVETNKQLFHH